MMCCATDHRPRLLVISAVMPFPHTAGQHARVRNTLRAVRERFVVTFLGLSDPSRVTQARDQLAEFTDTAIVLPRLARSNILSRAWHRAVGAVYQAQTGLRYSNYLLGEVELCPARVVAHCSPMGFDLVLYEYWHTYATTSLFRRQHVPCVLDMHDVLWQAYDRILELSPLPWMRVGRRRRVESYKRIEEQAWACYDSLIAINSGEAEYVRSILPCKQVLLAPMGVDLAQWPYNWCPAYPPRVAFYGSLTNVSNRAEARHCLEGVMPVVWKSEPDTELWIIGANPPEELRRLGQDPRVHVTGFVPNVAEMLATMRLILCPWQGKFGFRSRLIEVMAVGVPVVASPDAVYGMDLEPGQGLLLAEDDEAFARHCLALIQRDEYAAFQSRMARVQAEERYSFESTYGRLAEDLQALALGYRDARVPQRTTERITA